MRGGVKYADGNGQRRHCSHIGQQLLPPTPPPEGGDVCGDALLVENKEPVTLPPRSSPLVMQPHNASNLKLTCSSSILVYLAATGTGQWAINLICSHILTWKILFYLPISIWGKKQGCRLINRLLSLHLFRGLSAYYQQDLLKRSCIKKKMGKKRKGKEILKSWVIK